MGEFRNWIHYQGIQTRYGNQSKNLTEALRYFSYFFIASIIISKGIEFKIGDDILLSSTQLKLLLILCIIFILIDILQYTVSSFHNFILSIVHINKKLYKSEDSSKLLEYKKELDDTEKIFELDCTSIFIYEKFLPFLFFSKLFISFVMIMFVFSFLIIIFKSLICIN
nr:hypothetical protein GTC16762_31310 [Pigmentibacter ruber]